MRVESIGINEQPKIPSLLWLDLYKLTMGNLVFQEYPEVGAKYEFINRGKTLFPKGFGEKLRNQVDLMGNLRLTDREEPYLRKTCPYLSPEYIDWLKDFRLNPKEVEINQEEGDLSINVEGPWKSSIFWETHLMELICELYYEETGQQPDADYILRAKEKGRRFKESGAKLLEFGTRRAYSTKVHRNVLEALIQSAGVFGRDEGGVLLGTSNVALAMEFGLNPSGTFAHEWVMAHAGMFGIENANRQALEVWAKHYEHFPKLMTALTDTYTTAAFLTDITPQLADKYRRYRQDSGNPFIEGERLVAGINRWGFEPKTKEIVFSDNLNTDRALQLQENFGPKIDPSFGIGTHLTNDVGVIPLNIVVKLHSIFINGREVGVAKLSDEPGKASGDPTAVIAARRYADSRATEYI